MKLNEYLKGEAAEVEYCGVRDICPVGMVCGTRSCEGRPALFPTIIEVEKGDMLWTDMRFEQRVFVIRQGIFVSMAHCDQEREVPLALYGTGIAIGMAELYVPRDVATMSDEYYMKALFPGKICSLSAEALRRAIEAQPYPCSQTVMTCALTNQFVMAFSQAKITSRQSLYNRITALLLLFKEMAGRNSRDIDTFHITHEEIAQLVSSDRVSTTRVLHKMRDEGLIKMGYKEITLLEGIMADESFVRDASAMFYSVKEILDQHAKQG